MIVPNPQASSAPWALGAAHPARPGDGELQCALVHSQSAVVTSFATAPLKLLVPCSHGPIVHACATTYGGGLVAGDQIALRMRLDDGARLVLGTQATTKVYRTSDLSDARQEFHAQLERNALLAILPDATTCYAHARYAQTTRVQLDASASLLVLDWLTSGRCARGESWDFTSYRTSTEVAVAGRVCWRDALQLDGVDLKARMGRFHVLGHVLMLGCAFAHCSAALLARIARMPVRRMASLLVSASPLGDGLLLRLAATTHAAAQQALRELLAPALALVGGDPWLRRG